MRKRMIAFLMMGILFSLTLGVGCGKAAVENIAVKKTEAEPEPGKETVSSEEAGQAAEGKAYTEKKEVGREEKGRKPVMQEEPKETEKQKALRERLGAPEQYQAEFTDAQGVFCKIDAQVEVPDTDYFVTAPASLMTFGEEEIAEYVKPLLGEGGLYRWEPEGYQDCVENIAYHEYSLKLEEDERMRELLEKELQRNKEKLEGWKDEAEKVEVPLRMTSYDKMGWGVYYDYLFGLTDWEGKTMYLQAAKYGFGLYTWPFEGAHSCMLSEEDARAAAEECVEKMGLSGELVLDGVKKPTMSYAEGYVDDDAFYEFYYTRPVCGVPVGRQITGMGGKGLEICVDDNGVSQITYSDYILEGNEETARLLPFSEIRRVCEEEWKESDRRQELISVSADKLRLTYYWDEEGTENMIPVWELTGTFRFSTEEGGEREESDSILMINAIDGTIISRF